MFYSAVVRVVESMVESPFFLLFTEASQSLLHKALGSNDALLALNVTKSRAQQ